MFRTSGGAVFTSFYWHVTSHASGDTRTTAVSVAVTVPQQTYGSNPPTSPHPRCCCRTLGLAEVKKYRGGYYAYIQRGRCFYSSSPSYKPTAEEAAKAKALINFLMEDRFFLALYRSNDPKVRAAAMDKLNNAHHQAYGDASTQDDDADGVAEQ